jgi:hypothetical protein
MQTDLREYAVELEGYDYPVPVSSFAFAGVQVIPEYGSTTGVIEIKRSMTGNPADAVSFSTAVTPNMTTRAIKDTIDIRDVAYLHIDNTTADSGKRCRVYIHLAEE